MALSSGESLTEVNFRERITQAIARRVGPGSQIRSIDLARALQVSEDTIWGWVSGTKMPNAENVWKLWKFFGVSFLREVYNDEDCRLVDMREIRDAAGVFFGTFIETALDRHKR